MTRSCVTGFSLISPMCAILSLPWNVIDDPLILVWSAPATEGALQECSRETPISGFADVGAQHLHVERHTLLDHFRQDQLAVDLKEREPVITDQPALPRQVGDGRSRLRGARHPRAHKLL